MNTPDDRRGPDAPPSDFRQVAVHVAITIAFTFGVLLVAAASSGSLHTALIVASPLVALAGALALLVRTYRAWRAGRRWQVWQGGSWFLLAFFIFVLFGSTPTLMS